LSYTSPEILSA
jgi:serine/threonine protein kinase